MIRGYVRKQNALIERQKYSSVGASDLRLVAYRDPALFLAEDFDIFLSESDNFSLTRDVDYLLLKDVLYSNSQYDNQFVASSLRIINPDYRDVDLYITYRWVADYASDDMMNRFDRALDQMTDSILTTVEAGIVVGNDGNLVVQGTSWAGFRGDLNNTERFITEPPQLPFVQE